MPQILPATSAHLCRSQTEEILGYAVYAGTMDELAGDIVAHVRNPALPPGWLACLNPHSYAVACDGDAFRSALQRATWLVPDGAGVVLASRLLGGRIRHRLSGPDVFQAVSAAMNARGPFTAMFLGSTPGTLAALARQYRANFANAVAVETHAPPFRADFDAADLASMREAVRRAAPDLLWVGLTAPKQELLLHSLGPDAGYRFAGAIGAAFDFYAGNVRRSAPAFRRLGFEWLPRLLQEPRRLWRRTFVSAPRFLGHVAVRAVSVRLLGRS